MTASEEQVPPLTARIREGYRLRQEGRIEEAREIFLAVWGEAKASQDLYHACAVAHQLAVLDPTPMDEKLRWNLESLRLADAMDEVPDHWYTSMYLATGYAYFHLNRLDEAETAYRNAELSLALDDTSEYARGVREAIVRGSERLRERRSGERDEGAE